MEYPTSHLHFLCIHTSLSLFNFTGVTSNLLLQLSKSLANGDQATFGHARTSMLQLKIAQQRLFKVLLRTLENIIT